MYAKIDFNELKEIQKQILKGISLRDTSTEFKTVAAFTLTFKERKTLCAAVVVNLETKEVLEEKQTITEELMPYSPNFVAFREGPAIMQTLKELTIKPDLLLIEGIGVLLTNKVGTASYVAVLSNKPCIAVSKTLILGRLDEERILVHNEVKGFALKTKEFANPVYLTIGGNISLETALAVIKKCVNREFKMPYPLHLAHKALLELKRKTSEVQVIESR